MATTETGRVTPLEQAAIRAGCSRRQAQLLAIYARSETLAHAAQQMGIAESTAKNHMTAIRRRLKAPHTAAVVARLLE